MKNRVYGRPLAEAVERRVVVDVGTPRKAEAAAYDWLLSRERRPIKAEIDGFPGGRTRCVGFTIVQKGN